MSNPRSWGPRPMLDSGPCDEIKVLGWQSPHMRLTYVATPGRPRTAPPAATTHSPNSRPHREKSRRALTTHPPYEGAARADSLRRIAPGGCEYPTVRAGAVFRRPQLHLASPVFSSPERAATQSVVVRATGASAISIEEGADDAGDVLRLIEKEQVSAAVDDMKARVRDPRGEHTRVAQRDARIVVAADDEGR